MEGTYCQKKIGDRFPGGPNPEGSARKFYEHPHAPTKGGHTQNTQRAFGVGIAHASSATWYMEETLTTWSHSQAHSIVMNLFWKEAPLGPRRRQRGLGTDF